MSRCLSRYTRPGVACLLLLFGSEPGWAGVPDTIFSDGLGNTAGGTTALTSNTKGLYNTAFGITALGGNTIGDDNTASGAWALQGNSTGNDNTASGAFALYLRIPVNVISHTG
jgi:hypothetical protein